MDFYYFCVTFANSKQKTMKAYDIYVFDLDGTLLDTLDDLTNSVNAALEHAALPVHTREEIRSFVGNGVRLLIERSVPGGATHPLFDQVFDFFRQHYLEHGADNTRPYPGIMSLLTMLKERGKKIVVVSNKFYDATRSLCRNYFGDLIDVAVGEREGIRKKPAPDLVNEAFRELGVTRDEALSAVYIGDSDVDIETARNSGLSCISVLWGFRDRDFLLVHGATTFVCSPQEILE